jgi:putative inorganic carbon (HCO3(-)) transporter
MDGAGRAIDRPSAGVVGAVVVAAFLLVGTRQNFTVPYTGLGFSPAQLIFFVLGALWIVTRLVGQRARAGLGVLSILVAVQFALSLASYGLSQSRFLTSDIRTQSDRSVLILSTVSVLVIVLATVLRTRRDIELVLRGLVVGGTLNGVLAIISYAGGGDIAARIRLPGLRDAGTTAAVALVREGVTRPQGAAATPLELGGVMTALVPIALGVFFAARRRGEPAWPWAAAAAVMTLGGTVSLSRSVLLGLTAALIVMVPRWPVKRAVIALIGAVIAAGAVVASGAKIVSNFVNLVVHGSQDYSLGSRSDGRSYVWTHFAQHFWLGQGLGTYDLDTQKVLDNQYLSQLMETGVLGLLLLAALMVCALLYALRARALSTSPDLAELANGVAGALVAVLVISAVLDTSGFVQIFTLIWVLIGVAGALWRLAGSSDDSPATELSAARPAAVAAH